MFNMKTGGLLSLVLAIGTLVSSLLGGQTGTVAEVDSSRATAYADIAAMKTVCTLSAEEESAVNATLADLLTGMTETEINLARSLAGTKGLTMSGEVDRNQACAEGFKIMASLPG